MEKITVIITAYKEPKTIAKAIRAIALQIAKENEIIIVAPDKETLASAKIAAQKNKIIKVLEDAGVGKPAAMNLAMKTAKGDIIIWTDGDVIVSPSAVPELIKPFAKNNVGAVTGRPVSIDSPNTKYGFWAHVLSSVAHERRMHAQAHNQRMFCSGYLFAIRKKLMPHLSEELLSEDGYISHKVYEQNQVIKYAPKALVKISYPKNFNDWIKQKRRSVGGYNQNYKLLGVKIRSFGAESKNFWQLLKYAKNTHQCLWLFELFIARIYLWAIIYLDINIRKKRREEIWVRIDSTK